MRRLWEETPFAAILPCLIAGIQCAGHIDAYSFASLVLAASSLLAAALAALRQDRLAPALGAALAAIALSGMLLALARRDGFPDTDLRAFLARRELPLNDPVLFEGCVGDEAVRYRDETVLTVDMRALQNRGVWQSCRGRALVHVPVLDADGEAVPGSAVGKGDRVRGWARWQIPRNYRNPGSVDRSGFLSRRGIHLTGKVKSPRLLEVIPQDCGNPWNSRLSAARKRLLISAAILEQHGRRQASAVLSSLVVGDYSQLSASTREAFQNAGAYHVLVVSGMHIAWIAWVLIRLLGLFRCRRMICHFLVAFCIFFYTSVVGFQASIFRSLWMFILYLAGRALMRRCLPVNIVLASAFVLLAWRPDWLLEPGFQLSFLSVIAIFLSGLPFIEKILDPVLRPVQHSGDPDRISLQPDGPSRWGRLLRVRCELLAEACGDVLGAPWQSLLLAVFRTAAGAGKALVSMVVITASVQVWIEPVLAYHYNRLSWIAPLSNLIIVPMSSLVLAAGGISALTAGIPRFGTALVLSTGWLVDRFLGATQWIAGLPGAWQRCPTPPLSWVLGAIFMLLGWSFVKLRKPWIPCLIVVLLLALLSTGTVPRGDESLLAGNGNEGKATFKLTFLDVGEGDSIVMQFPNDAIWALDAGGTWQSFSAGDDSGGFDIGESVVSRYLWALGTTRLDRLILSHPDRDHAGGMPALIRNFHIGRFDYGGSRADAISRSLLAAALAGKAQPHPLHIGHIDHVAGVTVRVLNAPEAGFQRSTNEDSVVLHLGYGRFTALLTGDLEKAGEQRFLGRHPDLHAVLLKVAHHGSRSATSPELLRRLRPRWGIISVGRGNPFGHPSREVLSRMIGHRVRPLMTLDEGAITFETDGDRFVLSGYPGGILEQGILPGTGTANDN